MICVWRPDPPRQAAFSQAGNDHFRRRRSFADMRHVPATGLQPEGRRMSTVHPLLPLPRPSRARARSLRRPFTPSRTAGPYRLPHDVWDRLVSALAPARNRDAALALAVFLGRFWSTPNRLVSAFSIDPRALAGRAGLGLTEAPSRWGIRGRGEVGFLHRAIPGQGSR